MVRPSDDPQPRETAARAAFEANRLLEADCLRVAQALPASSLDLIYLDPPFFTGKERGGRGRAAFADRWQGGLDQYLAWLGERLEAMRPLLKPSGSIYVHLDWHAVHYVKVEMDRLFGYANFLNEIVWLYGLGGSSSRYWPRKHDTILWYARRRGVHYFHAAQVAATSQRMKGRLKKAPDYWHIPALNNMARERLGYPTQKPEALLARIVESSCPRGGVVADFFCGTGTTLASAHKAGRGWIGCDVNAEAIALARRRLEGLGATFQIARDPSRHA